MVKKERRRNDVKTEPFSHDFCIFPNCFSNKCSTFITKSTNLLQIKNCFWFSVKNIKVQFRHLNTIPVAFHSKSVEITIAIPVSFIAKKALKSPNCLLVYKTVLCTVKKKTHSRGILMVGKWISLNCRASLISRFSNIIRHISKYSVSHGFSVLGSRKSRGQHCTGPFVSHKPEWRLIFLDKGLNK